MRRTLPITSLILAFMVACCLSHASLFANEEVYSAPSQEELRASVEEWLAFKGLGQSPVVDAVEPFLKFENNPQSDELFDALMRTLYLADDDVRALVDQCRDLRYGPEVLQLKAPTTERTATEPLLGHNVKYFLARHLSMLTAYNEAVELFRTIDPSYVVDPAGCLFYQSVCEHHLLMREDGLESLDALLNRTENLPIRYQKLGELMLQDLEGVKEKSLGEVARQMKDVQRRLDLNKTDEDVQEVENKIVETLDELIKKLEDQQQQQQASGGGSGSSAPNQGANDTYLGGVKGEGLTDKKDIGNKDNWGDLPPKAREAAKNMLDRQFPSHYRQAVEEYLKKLADRPAPK